MLAFDIIQIFVRHKMFFSGKLGIKNGEVTFEMNQLASGNNIRLTIFTPHFQNLFFRIFIADIIDDLVEKLIFSQCHITVGQQFGCFQMIFGVHVEGHLHQPCRHIEIPYQKMIDCRTAQ